jgi:hypothetical protein
MADQAMRFVAVYETEEAARRAADAATRAGADGRDVRIGEPLDRVASVEGEMREEMDHTFAGPGNVGPFTPQMAKGMSLGTIIGGAIGLIVALPAAAIEFGDWPVWLRLIVVGVVGAIVGGTVGWIVGGGFGAERPDDALAAERGFPVSVPATREVEVALARTNPMRIDLVDADGTPLRPVDSRDDENIVRRLGRNLADEDRRD